MRFGVRVIKPIIQIVKPFIDVGGEFFKPFIDVGGVIVEPFIDVGSEFFKPFVDVGGVVIESLVNMLAFLVLMGGAKVSG